MSIDVFSLLKPTQMVHLATVEGTEPRLRPMTLIVMERRLFFATGSTDAKTAQIAANPATEWCLLERGGDYTGTMRCRGTMTLVSDPSLKQQVADHARFIYDYWRDAADPDFVLFELQPAQFRYMAPGDMKETVIAP